MAGESTLDVLPLLLAKFSLSEGKTRQESWKTALDNVSLMPRDFLLPHVRHGLCTDDFSKAGILKILVLQGATAEPMLGTTGAFLLTIDDITDLGLEKLSNPSSLPWWATCLSVPDLLPLDDDGQTPAQQLRKLAKAELDARSRMCNDMQQEIRRHALAPTSSSSSMMLESGTYRAAGIYGAEGVNGRDRDAFWNAWRPSSSAFSFNSSASSTPSGGAATGAATAAKMSASSSNSYSHESLARYYDLRGVD